MTLKRICILGILLTIILTAINAVYLFLKNNATNNAGERLHIFKNMVEDDYVPDCIKIKETHSEDGFHLIWKYTDETSIKKKHIDSDLYKIIAKSYVISILIDSINLSKQYDIEIKDSIFINIIWYNAAEIENMNQFIQSIVIRKYNLEINNVKTLINEIKSEYEKAFSLFYKGKYTREYFDKLINQYIGKDKEELSGTDSIRYIQMYEDYFSYYLEINRTLHIRDQNSFLNNCVGLYYYVGETTEEETIQKYKKRGLKCLESDLADIVPNMVEMFGDYSNNYYLNGCRQEAKKMEYSSDIFRKINETEEYSLSNEDINWGKKIFLSHMKKLIFEE